MTARHFAQQHWRAWEAQFSKAANFPENEHKQGSELLASVKGSIRMEGEHRREEREVRESIKIGARQNLYKV